MSYSFTDVALIRSQVLEAATVVAPFYPLSNFIAVNHLSGWEGIPFERALDVATKLIAADCYLPRNLYEKYSASGRISKAAMAEAAALYLPRGAGRSEEDLPGESCISLAELVCKLTGAHVVDDVNSELMKWCSVFFENGHSIWKMPYRELGFFSAWKKLVVCDQSARLRLSKLKQRVNVLPPTASETIIEILTEIGVGADKRIEYLARLIIQLPGWSSYIKWCQLNSSSENHRHVLIDYLAIRLCYEVEFCRAILKKKPYQLDPNLAHVKQYRLKFFNDESAEQAESGSKVFTESCNASSSVCEVGDIPLPVLQEAFEITYRDSLLQKLANWNECSEYASTSTSTPDAQLAFCIDVRSEGIRRHLEMIGNYQTIGFAGFFGLPVAFKPFGSHVERALCPVLLKPKYKLTECVASGAEQKIAEWASASSAQSTFQHVLHLLKSSFAAKFFFAEAAGLWCGPLSLFRTFFPKQLKDTQKFFAGSRPEEFNFSFEPSPVDDVGITLADRVFFAEASLRAMRLTDFFSPIVALIGHGSMSENNPYASSLDCGACGGNTGGYSARIVAAVLNDLKVREKLKERNISVPESTWFVAAEHNTTTDDVCVFDEDSIPRSHSAQLIKLKADLARAGESLRLERGRSFGESAQSVTTRALEWSQTRPEWGLARNAAFIASRRELTRGLDLERRVFLHDYNHEDDPSSQILELIMTAPLIVAQWINMQYYLSSVDNNKFGAGTKVTHNVIGNIGVMQGACSDLKIGLPLQSVAISDEVLYHEPMRLLAIIEASRSVIAEIVNRNKELCDIIKNRWIRLIAWENGCFFEASDGGTWRQLPDFRESRKQSFAEPLVSARGK